MKHIYRALFFLACLIPSYTKTAALTPQLTPIFTDELIKKIQEQRTTKLHEETTRREVAIFPQLPTFFILTKKNATDNPLHQRITNKKILILPDCIQKLLTDLPANNHTITASAQLHDHRVKPYEAVNQTSISQLLKNYLTCFFYTTHNPKNLCIVQKAQNLLTKNKKNYQSFFIKLLQAANEKQLPADFITSIVPAAIEHQHPAENQAKKNILKKIYSLLPAQLPAQRFSPVPQELTLPPTSKLTLEQVQAEEGARLTAYLQDYGTSTEFWLLRGAGKNSWIKKEKCLPFELLNFFGKKHYSLSPNNEFGIWLDTKGTAIAPFVLNPRYKLANHASAQILTDVLNPKEIKTIAWSQDNLNALIVCQESFIIIHFRYIPLEKDPEIYFVNITGEAYQLPAMCNNNLLTKTGHSFLASAEHIKLMMKDGSSKVLHIPSQDREKTTNEDYATEVIDPTNIDLKPCMQVNIKTHKLAVIDTDTCYAFSIKSDESILDSTLSASGELGAILLQNTITKTYRLALLKKNSVYTNPWAVSQNIPLPQNSSPDIPERIRLLITPDDKNIVIQLDNKILRFRAEELLLNKAVFWEQELKRQTELLA